jgi:hypothetical protein
MSSVAMFMTDTEDREQLPPSYSHVSLTCSFPRTLVALITGLSRLQINLYRCHTLIHAPGSPYCPSCPAVQYSPAWLQIWSQMHLNLADVILLFPIESSHRGQQSHAAHVIGRPRMRHKGSSPPHLLFICYPLNQDTSTARRQHGQRRRRHGGGPIRTRTRPQRAAGDGNRGTRGCA